LTLRLIALFKLLKGLVLVAVGLSVLRLLPVDVMALVTEWSEHLNVSGQRPHINAVLGRLTAIDQRTLASVGAAAFTYGGLLLTEAVGLWWRRRWAEYLTVISTATFIPLEVYELWKRFTPIRLGVIVLNIAIVVYLVKQLRDGRHAALKRSARTPPR
jgi:uncharacterized membrane protein (DUF2068 family)